MLADDGHQVRQRYIVKLYSARKLRRNHLGIDGYPHGYSLLFAKKIYLTPIIDAGHADLQQQLIQTGVLRTRYLPNSVVRMAAYHSSAALLVGPRPRR